MNRRNFLLTTLITLNFPNFLKNVNAEQTSMAYDVFESLSDLNYIEEVGYSGTLYIFFAPWCSDSKFAYNSSRKIKGIINLRWIPYSGNMTYGISSTQKLLEAKDPNLLEKYCGYMPPENEILPQDVSLAQKQDLLMQKKIKNLIIRDTGKTMPYVFCIYENKGKGIRFINGFPSEEEILFIEKFAL